MKCIRSMEYEIIYIIRNMEYACIRNMLYEMYTENGIWNICFKLNLLELTAALTFEHFMSYITSTCVLQIYIARRGILPRSTTQRRARDGRGSQHTHIYTHHIYTSHGGKFSGTCWHVKFQVTYYTYISWLIDRRHDSSFKLSSWH